MRSIAAIVLGGLVLVACAGGGDDGDGDGASEDDIAKRAHHYVDVSPDTPMTGVAREKILSALVKIDRVAKETKDPFRRALASETLARIESGDVLLGSIEASRGIDRWHMCKDEKMHACDGAAPAPDDTTWRGDAALANKLEKDLAGYQWGNRIYFSLASDTDVALLARTLVHETDHVANRSECHYYKNLEAHVVDPDPAYVEEYRAFLSECYFDDESATVPKCSASAAERVGEYKYAAKLSRVLPNKSSDPQDLAKLILASEPDHPAPSGRLIPRKTHWPKSFGACSAR